MGDHNSLETLRSVSLLVEALYRDIAQRYSVNAAEQQRDIAVMRRRSAREGIGFYTKTLPRLGKALDKALHSEVSLKFPGFARRRGTAIPRFIWWLLERVLCTETGYVRSDADITALKDARQLLAFAYKLNIPYDQETENSVIDSFIRTEEELATITGCESFAVDPIVAKARTLLCKLFAGFEPGDIVPKHGPGSVATGEEIGEKSNFSRIYSKLEHGGYPFTEYFTMGASHVADQYDWIQGLQVLDRATAKVVLVPKDSRGPRLISCEPLELQWIQQGLQRKLYPWIERHPMTAGYVNFTDQSVNRRLALEGSRSGEWVTLDMKDASDRVSLKLVERLFQGTSLLSALLASRSDETRVPDGRLVPLSKFAPMGSAVCFPVEAICFWALAVSVLWLNGRGSSAMTSVYVYGDDIIVRASDYKLVQAYFPRVGLKFNVDKCCTGGFFRESCGCDAYKGVDVTPLRLRTSWCHRNTRNPTELSSYCALSNALWKAGYWGTAELIRRQVEDRYGPLPYYDDQACPMPTDTNVDWGGMSYDRRQALLLALGAIPGFSPGPTPTEPRSYLGFCRPHVNHHHENLKRLKYRLNHRLHRIEFLVWTVTPKRKSYEVDGWRELLRVQNTKSSGSTSGSYPAESGGGHLPVGVYALPRRICLKRGWRSVV